ncbi:MAG: zinc ribbon domain-containing protein [Phycisphaerae bacterium]|nr:zinc ribbon domain-containing protein [Phycisphaerae bacterium]
MRYKTLFRVLVKVIGVALLAMAIVTAAETLPAIINELIDARMSTMFGIGGSTWMQIRTIWSGPLVTFLVEAGLGLYLLLGGKWLANIAIPNNRPYCGECGYELTKAQSTTCPECGAPVDPGEAEWAARALHATATIPAPMTTPETGPRVAGELTEGALLDAHVENLLVRTRALRVRLVVALVIGFVLAVFSWRTSIDWGRSLGVVMIPVTGGLVALVLALPRLFRSNTRAHIRRTWGRSFPLRYALELRDEGVWSKIGDLENQMPWSLVRAVTTADDRFTIHGPSLALPVLAEHCASPESFHHVRERALRLRVAAKS